MIDSSVRYGLNSRMGSIASSFATDMSHRISVKGGPTQLPQGEGEVAAAPEATQKMAQLQTLDRALGGTVAYMADTHGEKAASAMVALVYKRIGDDDINEESLGNAFLDTTRFLDANFGTDAGDAFMGHLNGALNDSMNAFFDNGHNEQFFDAASVGGAPGSGVNDMLEKVAEQYTDSIKTMLAASRATGSAPLAGYGLTTPPGQLQGIFTDTTV